MSGARDLLLIAALSGVVLFTALGIPQLWDRDEPRNAGCAAEMLKQRDWVVPVFNGQLRDHKPIMIYWLTMACYSIMGINEFAARFPSAVLGMGTVMLTYLIGCRLFDRSVAWWSACVLLTSVMFAVSSRAATTDSGLTFFSTLALCLFIYGAPQVTFDRARADPEVHRSWHWPFPSSLWWASLIYASMGLAVLTKGPVGLVMPTAAIGMHCLIQRWPTFQGPPANSWWNAGLVRFRWLGGIAPRCFFNTCWAMRPLTAATVVLLVAGPWYVWVGLRTDGAWLRGFFFTHNFGRAISSMEGHDGGPWYYALTLLVGCFPWSVFSVPVLMEAVRQWRGRGPVWEACGLNLCWIGVYLALFSLAQTKLPSYILPAYPAVALLVGNFLVNWLRQRAQTADWWVPVGMVILALVGVALVAGLAIALRNYLPHETALCLIGAIPVIVGLVAWWALRVERPAAALSAFMVGAVTFVIALVVLAPVRISRHHKCQELMASIHRRAPNAQLAAFGCLEPSWVYYARRNIREYTAQEEAAAVAYLAGGSDRFLITTGNSLEVIRRHLGGALETVAVVPYFLKDELLIAVHLANAPTARIPQAVAR